MRWISFWLCWIFLGIISTDSHAMKCNVIQPTGVFKLPSINVPANVQMGTFLSGWIETPLSTPYSNCTPEGEQNKVKVPEWVRVSSSVVGKVTDGGASYDIYSTPTVGIGYILKGRLPRESYQPILGGNQLIYETNGVFPIYDYYFSIRLVATGAGVVNPGVINPFAALQTDIYECTVAGCVIIGGHLIANWTASSGAVTGRTCSIANKDMIFSLPAVREKDMPSVGATAGSLTRNIELNCPAGTNLYMVMTDQTMPANRSSVLTLTGDSQASGFGFEVLHKGKPVSFGPDSESAGTENQFLVGSNLSGPVSIPLTARYIRTSLTSRAGSAKGFATFTMSYQ
jgi:type 1 fimbria pilin